MKGYFTCPECEANFRAKDLKNGALPSHKFLGKKCAGSGTTAVKENPPSNARPLYGERTGKMGVKHMIGLRVYEIRYQHAADGLDYKHPFSTGAIMWGMPDGSIVIESATGDRLWENRDV